MRIEKAKEFIKKNARPIDLAVYSYFFEKGNKQDVVNELAKYQNSDGGFAHGLEADNFNPYSNPIATNDALITLFRVKALDPQSDIVKKMVAYLASHDSFDEEQKRWLFAIESNKNYPHAIWWEKDGNGINAFNPTVSLAAFMLVYGKKDKNLYTNILIEAFNYLKANNDFSGDALKSYLLAYELLLSRRITAVVDLNRLIGLIKKRLQSTICTDVTKYGVEYVALPSDFFNETYTSISSDDFIDLIKKEQEILAHLQKEDGGFDISWKWGTPYTEYELARTWWRAKITIDKMLFYTKY